MTRDGPVAEVLKNTDVLIVTPAASADRIYKANFRPDFLIVDEATRMKPVSTLVLVANYTPLVYVLVGDHLQNGPLVFSQHMVCNTFGLQQRVSWFKAAIATNHPSSMLTYNYRHMTANGTFFNEQSYNGKITFSKIAVSQMTTSVRHVSRWIKNKVIPQDPKRKANFSQGFSVMLDMNSRETVAARTMSNRVNDNFAVNVLTELLADKGFTGNVMLIATMGPFEVTRNGTFFAFPEARVEVRTAQAAQGAEADVVIVDFTRSEKPGMTSQAEFVNVVSSRGRVATVYLHNETVFRDPKMSRDPKHKAKEKSHREEQAKNRRRVHTARNSGRKMPASESQKNVRSNARQIYLRAGERTTSPFFAPQFGKVFQVRKLCSRPVTAGMVVQLIIPIYQTKHSKSCSFHISTRCRLLNDNF